MENEYIEKYIDAGGLRVCYYDEGKSDCVVLLLHAFPLNKAMWHSQMQMAGEHLRLVAPDLRGFGGTEPGEEKFSLALFNKDLENFILTLGLKKPILCGLSLGGYQALFAANANAGRYKGFIFCSTQCIADSPEIREKRSLQILEIETKGLENFAEKFLEKALGEKSRPALLQVLLTIAKQNQVKPVIQTLLALAERPETCTGLKGLKQPVLILAGKEDKVISYMEAQLLKSRIDDGLIYLMEDVGHFCNVENPTEFNRLLRDFLHKNNLSS